MSTTAAASTPQMSPEEAVRRIGQARELLLNEVHKVIIGQDEMIEQMLICVFARGHCLTIGVPGLAKTLTVSTLAQALHMRFHRIQFTPDLMPSDITGTEIIDQDAATGKRSFRFVKGPIFANIVLADEINRTPPKTQAALLQAMQEYEVTSAGTTYQWELPFFVMATQNPIEQEGTYPLPEAQLDRFMLSINIGYPTRAEEREIVMSTTQTFKRDIQPVLQGRDILWIQQLVRQVPASQHMVDYAVDLARATRPKEPPSPDFVKNWLAWGAGPRAAQYLILGAKARAILHGRYTVSADDIRHMAYPVMRHRIFTNFNADAEGIDVDQVIEKILETVPEPAYGEPVTPRPRTDRAPSRSPHAAAATSPKPVAGTGAQVGAMPASPTPVSAAPVSPTPVSPSPVSPPPAGSSGGSPPVAHPAPVTPAPAGPARPQPVAPPAAPPVATPPPAGQSAPGGARATPVYTPPASPTPPPTRHGSPPGPTPPPRR
jgi:MoxR-like ATPase